MTSSQVQMEFPTNPISKYFHIEKHVASAGPEMVWKIYDAQRRNDQEICSVFLFEKFIADKLHKPRRREIVSSLLKREVKLLSQLKHPNLLKVIHPVEETNETICFATERIVTNLANILGNHLRLPNPLPVSLRNIQLSDMDRKLGIYQITSVLRFLHTGQSLFHNNVCPSSIFINHRGQWRLGCVAFLEPIDSDHVDRSVVPKQTSGKIELGMSPWSKRWPKMARPDYHYSAPECLSLTAAWTGTFGSLKSKTNQDLPNFHGSPVQKNRQNELGEDRPGPWSDMFSFGLLICAIYNSSKPSEDSVVSMQKSVPELEGIKLGLNGEPITTADILGYSDNNTEVNHALQLSKSVDIPEAFRSSVLRMPLALVEAVEKMLSRNPQKRPSSQLFALLKYFNDSSMVLLDGLINFDQKDEDEQTRTLQMLQSNTEQMTKTFIYSRIVPLVMELFKQLEHDGVSKTTKASDLDYKQRNFLKQMEPSPIGLLIQGFAHIVSCSTASEYANNLEASVNFMFRNANKPEVKVLLMHNLESFRKYASDNSVRKYFLPVLKQCLESSDFSVQIAAMNNIKQLVNYYSQEELETVILSQIKKALYKDSPLLQSAALNGVENLIPNLNDRTIIEQIVPLLIGTSVEITKQSNNQLATFSISASMDEGDSKIDGQKKPVEHPILILCYIWKKIISSRAGLIQSDIIAEKILPGLLPHVLNKNLNLNEFRTLMSTLYAFLDVLDLSNLDSDDTIDHAQYRIIPAVTVDAPTNLGFKCSQSNSRLDPSDISPSLEPRKSITRAAVPFVPMLHPNQIRELENSLNMPRRASAHVICPLPPQESTDIRTDRWTSNLDEKQNSSSLSFLGLQLPSVSRLRRHSCDAPKAEKSLNQTLQNQDDHDSHCDSQLSLNESSRVKSGLNSTSQPITSSDDKNLLTAQVCEGPFVRNHGSHNKLVWNLEPSSPKMRTRGTTISSKYGNELGVIPAGRRSSFTAIGDTVMNLLMK